MSTTGALPQVYRAAGALEYGSFALEPPTAGERGQTGTRVHLSWIPLPLSSLAAPGRAVPAT